MIALRPAAPDDAAAIAAIYAPHVTDGTASFETSPPDAATMAGRMAAGGGLYPWIVATEAADGPVLGYAYAAAYHTRAAYAHTVETTVYLAGAAQRRGVGRRLYGALIDTLRAQGFVSAIGVIALPNPGSVALHEAIGFRHVGTLRAVGCKHRAWIDVGYWQCALADPSLPAPALSRFAETGLA